MCTVLLPPGDNQIAVNKYIISLLIRFLRILSSSFTVYLHEYKFCTSNNPLLHIDKLPRFCFFPQSLSTDTGKKGKRISLQTCTGHESTYYEVEDARFQDIWHMKVVRLSAIGTGRLYPPGNISCTHFCQ
jgi:hypothetical protein